MDQCTNCECRGNLSKCMATDCTYHELWMVKAIELKYQREIIALTNEAQQKDAADRICNCGEHERGRLTSGWRCPIHGLMF